MDHLKTLTQIATENGFTDRQVDYAIRSARIEAAGRIGSTRLFDADQVAFIIDTIRQRIESRRPEVANA